jgi:FkbM family methyltransferase
MIQFFDIGQNRGDVSNMLINIAKELGQQYQLIGVEANPRWYHHCCDRFADDPNVTCLNYAIASHNGPVKLYQCTTNDVGDSIYSDKFNCGSSNIEVPGITATKLLRTFHSYCDIRVVKINIEGAEYDFFNDYDPDITPVDVFCGTNDDVLKVKSLSEKAKAWYQKLAQRGIVVHRFSDFEPHKNADLKGLIQGEI